MTNPDIDGDVQRWSLEHGRLVLQTGDGVTHAPSAHEIWSSVFQGGRTIGGVAIQRSPAEDLPELSFSRFPADLVVRVTGDPIHGIGLNLAAKVAGDVIPLE